MRLALLTVLALLLSGCAAKNADDAGATPEVNDTNPDGIRPAVLVEASLFDRTPGVGVPPTTMGIDPSNIELAVGVPVNLTVTNNGNSAHDLVIDGLDVATELIEPGASFSVEFTPTEAGTFVMYCSVGGDSPVGHRSQGMVGEVVVA